MLMLGTETPTGATAGAVTGAMTGGGTGFTTILGADSIGAGDGTVTDLLSAGVAASIFAGRAAGSLDVSTVARFLNIRI